MRNSHTYRKISASHALKISWLILTHSEPLVYYVPIESVACLGFIIFYTYLTLSLTDEKKKKKKKNQGTIKIYIALQQSNYKRTYIQTDIQWLTSNTDNAYHPIVTHNLDIGINTDASLLVWDIKYTTNPS